EHAGHAAVRLAANLHPRATLHLTLRRDARHVVGAESPDPVVLFHTREVFIPMGRQLAWV
ncbi:MAG: hypothetical protein ABGY41_07630, partial [Candidatus Poribacteria bacterium]